MTGDTLKKSILQLAIMGKLVSQNSKDEPASKLLEKINKEREKLIKEGKLKKQKFESIKEDEIPFEIPNSWVWVRLFQITYLVGNKYNQILSSEILKSGRVPVVSQGQNLIDGYCNNMDKIIKDIPLVMFGDHTKNVKYINFNFVIGADGTKFHKCIVVSAKYIYYWMLLISSQLPNKGYARHYSLLKKELIPIPPLAEQERIVKKLEQILPLVEEYGKNEEKLSELNKSLPDKLKQSILQYAVQGKLVKQNPNDEPAIKLLESIKAEKEKLIKEGKIKKDKNQSYIFRRDNSHYEKIGNIEHCIDAEIPFEIPKSWQWVRLGEIGFSNIGLTYSPTDITLSKKGIPVLRSSNIKNNKIDLTDLVRVTTNIRNFNLYVQEGDIIICVRNGSKNLVGKSAIIETLKEKMSFGAFMAIFRSNINNWIKIYLDSPLFKKNLESISTETINQITQSNLKNALVPIPPLAEQKRIVEKVKQIFSYL